MEHWWNSGDRGKTTPTIFFVKHFTYATKEPMPTDSMNAAYETVVSLPISVY